MRQKKCSELLISPSSTLAEATTSVTSLLRRIGFARQIVIINSSSGNSLYSPKTGEVHYLNEEREEIMLVDVVL
ncbi:hypothetical protein A2291_03645 [candidate division WOR-1 bacterium RIFOXYB2_FULL_42_35]|uniref:Uncharacterized protein n=1 Tax=candidate division WOR-1 bacterium RIFOXYC2_FULL_41_25 TaxID=1802586 RepID=A0A1F4TQP5_UNCSA|nr:MAG: hypothetical protein A2247_03215 [candidate division WOR-1 bacterium RIFOXYA2_FULL_41_14]OGC25556.1 MAG: hypothetical protein A2291_03645 [candidate division WOR-1 bacterium RIFOXYB2_FULL_42_35]OGC34988.1 MAG: hypothetical protein A2462_05275 [candidate division WOR-1 bacterium RIFOXYC2_FULL_41_25]OGC42645.1 MAG: hypothetical protein A2548_01370 [candidate division WOR-1 bacterium RIFOXYD2_FULL_41_8]